MYSQWNSFFIAKLFQLTVKIYNCHVTYFRTMYIETINNKIFSSRSQFAEEDKKNIFASCLPLDRILLSSKRLNWKLFT